MIRTALNSAFAAFCAFSLYGIDPETLPPAMFKISGSSVMAIAKNISPPASFIAPGLENAIPLLTVASTFYAKERNIDLLKPFELTVFRIEPELSFYFSCSRVNMDLECEPDVKFFGTRCKTIRQNGRLIIHSRDLDGAIFPAAPRTDKKHAVCAFDADCARLANGFSFLRSGRKDGANADVFDALLKKLKTFSLSVTEPERGLTRLELETTFEHDGNPSYARGSSSPVSGSDVVFSGARALFRADFPAAATGRLCAKLFMPRPGSGKEAVFANELLNSFTGKIVIAAAEKGETRLLRICVSIDPEKFAKIKKTISTFDFTPFPDTWRIAKKTSARGGPDGALLCAADPKHPDRLIFVFAPMEPEALKQVMTTLPFKGSPLERASLKLEPINPDKSFRAMADGKLERGRFRLTFEADGAFFKRFGPLLDKPLPLPDFTGGSDGRIQIRIGPRKQTRQDPRPR